MAQDLPPPAKRPETIVFLHASPGHWAHRFRRVRRAALLAIASRLHSSLHSSGSRSRHWLAACLTLGERNPTCPGAPHQACRAAVATPVTAAATDGPVAAIRRHQARRPRGYQIPNQRPPEARERLAPSLRFRLETAFHSTSQRFLPLLCPGSFLGQRVRAVRTH